MTIKRNVLLLGLFFSSATLNIFSAEKSLSSLRFPDSASDRAGKARRFVDIKEEIDELDRLLMSRLNLKDSKLNSDHIDRSIDESEPLDDAINTHPILINGLMRSQTSDHQAPSLPFFAALYGLDNLYLHDLSNDPHEIRMAQIDREHPVTIQDLITAGTAPDIDTRIVPGEAHLSFFDRITSLEGMQNFPRKDDVTILFFTMSLHLKKLPINAFADFKNLKKILIHGSTLKSIKAGAFDGLPHLKEISIEFNSQLIDIEPGAFTNVAPQLEKINLKNNPLPEEVKRRIRDEVQAVSPRTKVIF